MPDDEHLIRLVQQVEALAASHAELARRQETQEERLSERFSEMRQVAESVARAETDSVMRGIMMSWPDLAKDLGALQAEVHGPHGVERRLEEVSIAVFGAQGRNGLRGQMRELTAVVRSHRWAIGFIIMIGVGIVGALLSYLTPFSA